MTQILLIDDDVHVRDMLRMTLEYFGHTVTEARNGQEGIDLLNLSKPDLVITDLVMPVKGGFEVMIELKMHHPTVKLIVMSGGGRRGPQDSLPFAHALGATRVLAKPFATGLLMAIVNELLADSGSEAAARVRPPGDDSALFVKVSSGNSAVSASTNAEQRPWRQKLKEG